MADFLNWTQDLFNSGLLNLLPYLTGAYLLILYLALIIWVINDSLKRSQSLLFQIFAASLLIFTNLLGLIIYLIIRPRQTLTERAFITAELKTLNTSQPCPKCRREIDNEFLYCPFCQTKIQNRCLKCRALLKKEWQACPHCGQDCISETRSTKHTRSTKKKTVLLKQIKPIKQPKRQPKRSRKKS